MQPRASTYAALLALIPMITLVFRHGWQGAGFGLACTSVSIHVLTETMDARVPRDVMQMFLAVLGAVTLMLGASVSALRNTRDVLSERSDLLAAQSEALRALSQRLVKAQEDVQRNIAQDLQSDIEHGVTALGTHLGLLARTQLGPAQMAAVDTLRGLTQNISSAMRDVLQQLQPGALDRHGLERALERGPIRDLLADAQIHCDLILRGPIDTLDRDAQSAIYRICQDIANDCVRRGESKRVELRLRVAHLEGTHFDVLLKARYELDARRLADSLPTSMELPGTRDRALAFGGDYASWIEGCELHHRDHFVRLDPASESTSVS
jgi:two-component system sensor histidine kinase UhpB